MSETSRPRALKWIGGFALLALALVLAEAQFHILKRLLGTAPLTQRELAMEYLGRHLAARFPGKKAVVLSNPFSKEPNQPAEVYQFEKAGLRGLERGLEKAVTIEAVEFPAVKPGFTSDRRSVFIDPATTTPLSYVVAEGALDEIASRHPGAEILVSLIGLPVTVRQTETWKISNPRKFALLLPDLRMLGDEGAIRQAFQSGKIAVCVMNKPGGPAEDVPMTVDPKAEFDRRFILVSGETIDDTLRAWPRLFR